MRLAVALTSVLLAAACAPQAGAAVRVIGCATLLVRRAGARRSARVRIGFGVRCR